MKPSPRQLALEILNRIDDSHETLDQLIDGVDIRAPELSKQDRALFNALIHGALRWRGRLDWIIRHFSSTPFKKIAPPVRNVLRLGLFQIIHLDRVPVSAAVNTSVELSKTVAASWTTGFINGVLRTAAREHRDVQFPDPAKNPIGSLTAEKSIPEWLARRWLNRFAMRETMVLCDTINAVPPVTLRTNTLRTTRENLIAGLSPHSRVASACRYSPEGIRLGILKTRLDHLSDFKTGGFQVQDEAAQLISHFLDPVPNEHILDASAGLGGKTGHIAQLMGNRGRLQAMEISRHKLTRLRWEMKRLGIRIVSGRHRDILQMDDSSGGRFDRVLLDAPCSGLGVLRRNPDAKWRESKKRLSAFRATQLQLLENLSVLVKPSGILVYSVCSMEPEETDGVIEAFLARRQNYAIDTDISGMPEPARCVVDHVGRLRTFPHRHDTDGFFAVRLRRVG